MSGSLLDTIAHPTVINPLSAYQDASKVASGVWANRQNLANQLSGAAMQGAINGDGTYSPEAYRQNLQTAGPDAALAAQSGLGANQTLSSDQLEQQLKKTNWTNQASGAALQSGDFSDAGMMKVMQQGLSSGVLNIADVQKQLSTMPPDPAGRKAWLEQHQATSESIQQQLEQQYGTPVTTDDGQVIRGGVRASPQRGGAINVPGAPSAPGGQGVQKVTGPDANAELVEVTTADGAKYKVPRSSLPGASGATPPASPLGTGRNSVPAALRKPGAPQDAPAPAPATPPAASGAPPASSPAPAGATPQATAPATPATPAGLPAGAVPTGLPVGAAEEMKGSVQHAIDARNTANTYQSRIQPIEGALTALAGADTGKGGDTLNTIRAYTQDIAPSFIQRMLPGSVTDPKSRIAYEEANKYLTGMAINAPGGSRSDSGQAAAGAATPSVHISNQAAQLVAQAALAQQRLTQAGTLAFNKTGQPAANYDRFMNTWNTNADPRAFIADKMTGPQRADLVKNMGGVGSPAYQKFKQSYQDGITNGVMAQHVGP